jgi:hypothetical protein
MHLLEQHSRGKVRAAVLVPRCTKFGSMTIVTISSDCDSQLLCAGMPLMHAAATARIVELLLREPAERNSRHTGQLRVDYEDPTGRTPLLTARTPGVAFALLEAGADPEIRDGEGISIIDKLKHRVQKDEEMLRREPEARWELTSHRAFDEGSGRRPLTGALNDAAIAEAVIIWEQTRACMLPQQLLAWMGVAAEGGTARIGLVALDLVEMVGLRLRQLTTECTDQPGVAGHATPATAELHRWKYFEDDRTFRFRNPGLHDMQDLGEPFLPHTDPEPVKYLQCRGAVVECMSCGSSLKLHGPPFGDPADAGTVDEDELRERARHGSWTQAGRFERPGAVFHSKSCYLWTWPSMGRAAVA